MPDQEFLRQGTKVTADTWQGGSHINIEGRVAEVDGDRVWIAHFHKNGPMPAQETYTWVARADVRRVS